MLNRMLFVSCTALCVEASSTAYAAQNDQQPTDFVALPNGSLNVAAAISHQSLDGPWENGIKKRTGEGSADIFVLRLIRHYSIGEEGKYTIAPVIALSSAQTYADAKAVPFKGGDASGLGDLRLGTAFWFYRNDADREYVMSSLVFSLPTGEYVASQPVNIGENRIKTVVSLGWMQPLGQRWVLDLVPEVAFFGDNTQYLGNFRLSQDVAYAMTSTLRHKATERVHWYGSAQINRGGATQVSNGSSTAAPENTRLALGTLLFIDNSSQIQLRYAKDVNIQNGFRNTGEIALRWSTVFK